LKKQLKLYVPEYRDLWYRQKILGDAATMDYNKGYDLDFKGYHKDSGCIEFPPEQWRDWYDYFIGQEPKRFYAYVTRLRDGVFIGEVNVHKSNSAPWYEMGIVLEAGFRGQGYAIEALELLLQHAFVTLNAEAVHNDFEGTREAAIRTHLAVGFTECKKENGIVELLITREQYFAKQAASPC
jgi:acetyltransferase, GNAT family